MNRGNRFQVFGQNSLAIAKSPMPPKTQSGNCIAAKCFCSGNTRSRARACTAENMASKAACVFAAPVVVATITPTMKSHGRQSLTGSRTNWKTHRGDGEPRFAQLLAIKRLEMRRERSAHSMLSNKRRET